MNSIKQSIWYLLTYSKVFLIVLSLFIIFTFILNFLGNLSFFESIGLIIQMFIFIGIYLGGALAKLKRSYLWKNNRKYKYSLMHGFLIILGFINLLFVPFIWKYTVMTPLLVVMPFCTSVYASHLVLGKNLIYKILIPAIPIMIAKTSVFGFNINIIFALIFAATLVLIVLMYKNVFYKYKGQNNTTEKDNAKSLAFMTTGLSHKHLNQINGFIGARLSKWITSGTKDLDWAILFPHTRLAVITFFYSVILLLFMMITDPKIQKMIAVFTLMLLPNIFLGFIMESKNLLKQVKFFSHVFQGENHKQLKSKILYSLDKNMVFNSLVLIGLIFIIIKVLSVSISVSPFLISILVVFCLSLAISPLLMCLNWFYISLGLIIILTGYAASLYVIIKWVYANTAIALLPQYIITFVILSVVVRCVTQNIFWKRPIELIFKNH